MAENKRLVVTREGLQKMKEELEYKETTEKMRIAEPSNDKLEHRMDFALVKWA